MILHQEFWGSSLGVEIRPGGVEMKFFPRRAAFSTLRQSSSWVGQ
jgi:hypothetical protein